MRLSFHGAARSVTGSKHLLTLTDGTCILLDCGMFQGMGSNTVELNADFGFNAADVDIVLLSHAHIDHTGLLPKLVKEGFKGKIYTTEATRDLTEILLYDSAEIQTYAAGNHAKNGLCRTEEEPLYTVQDVADTMPLFEIVERDNWFKVADNVEVLLTNAGHLPGSAVINLKITENGKEVTITYSGDIGRYRSILLAPPASFPQADYIILESTYGNKEHNISYNSVDNLLAWIKETCLHKKGKLVIPAFSVGRTQELLFTLNQLELEKRLPPVAYFVDSPLSLKATTVIKKYVHHFNDRLQKILEIDNDPFAFEGLKHVETVEDSIRLTTYEEPCVIISSSGTGDAGRVRHHIHSCLQNPRHSILLSGYCSKQTLGGKLVTGEKNISLFGDDCTVAAAIDKMEGMSGHGDTTDLLRFLGCQEAEKVKKVFLTHGEYPTQQDFAERLIRKGFSNVSIPMLHTEVELD